MDAKPRHLSSIHVQMLGVKVVYHYNDVIIFALSSQITSLTIVYLAVIQGADQRKHQRSASLAFVRGIHRWPVNSPHKWPVTQIMFPFDDVTMSWQDIILGRWSGRLNARFSTRGRKCYFKIDHSNFVVINYLYNYWFFNLESCNCARLDLAFLVWMHRKKQYD